MADWTPYEDLGKSGSGLDNPFDNGFNSSFYPPSGSLDWLSEYWLNSFAPGPIIAPLPPSGPPTTGDPSDVVQILQSVFAGVTGIGQNPEDIIHGGGPFSAGVTIDGTGNIQGLEQLLEQATDYVRASLPGGVSLGSLKIEDLVRSTVQAAQSVLDGTLTPEKAASAWGKNVLKKVQDAAQGTVDGLVKTAKVLVGSGIDIGNWIKNNVNPKNWGAFEAYGIPVSQVPIGEDPPESPAPENPTPEDPLSTGGLLADPDLVFTEGEDPLSSGQVLADPDTSFGDFGSLFDDLVSEDGLTTGGQGDLSYGDFANNETQNIDLSQFPGIETIEELIAQFPDLAPFLQNMPATEVTEGASPSWGIGDEVDYGGSEVPSLTQPPAGTGITAEEVDYGDFIDSLGTREDPPTTRATVVTDVDRASPLTADPYATGIVRNSDGIRINADGETMWQDTQGNWNTGLPPEITAPPPPSPPPRAGRPDESANPLRNPRGGEVNRGEVSEIPTDTSGRIPFYLQEDYKRSPDESENPLRNPSSTHPPPDRGAVTNELIDHSSSRIPPWMKDDWVRRPDEPGRPINPNPTGTGTDRPVVTSTPTDTSGRIPTEDTSPGFQGYDLTNPGEQVWVDPVYETVTTDGGPQEVLISEGYFKDTTTQGDPTFTETDGYFDDVVTRGGTREITRRPGYFSSETIPGEDQQVLISDGYFEEITTSGGTEEVWVPPVYETVTTPGGSETRYEENPVPGFESTFGAYRPDGTWGIERPDYGTYGMRPDYDFQQQPQQPIQVGYSHEREPQRNPMWEPRIEGLSNSEQTDLYRQSLLDDGIPQVDPYGDDWQRLTNPDNTQPIYQQPDDAALQDFRDTVKENTAYTEYNPYEHQLPDTTEEQLVSEGYYETAQLPDTTEQVWVDPVYETVTGPDTVQETWIDPLTEQVHFPDTTTSTWIPGETIETPGEFTTTSEWIDPVYRTTDGSPTTQQNLVSEGYFNTTDPTTFTVQGPAGLEQSYIEDLWSSGNYASADELEEYLGGLI